MDMKKLSKWALAIGGLQLGLLGAFGFDLIGKVQGFIPMDITKWVYIGIGVAAVFEGMELVK